MMDLPKPLKQFRKQAQKIVDPGLVTEIEFSGETYQLLVLEKPEEEGAWAFMQLDPKGHRLRSYREHTTGTSMQCTVAVPKNEEPARFVDLDIDEANPGVDLVRFFKHIGEVLSSAPTDHLELWSHLSSEETTAPFIYYEVVEPV